MSQSGKHSITHHPLSITHPYVDDIAKELKESGIVRWPDDPFAGPNGSPETSSAMFNPSLAVYQDRLVSLIRAFGKDESSIRLKRNEGVSTFFRARFKEDGMTLEDLSNAPVFRPEGGQLDVEDPRTTFIDGVYYVAYVSTKLSDKNVTLEGNQLISFKPELACTLDFENYHRFQISGMPEFTKDFVLFPRKVNGEYLALHRPTIPDELANNPVLSRFYAKEQGIWLARSHDLRQWYGHRKILNPASDEIRIGAGAPPIETEDGWVLFYHAVKMDKHTNKRIYSGQLALLDRFNPQFVKSVSDYILTPQRDYERKNPEILDLEHVFFTGAVPCEIVNGSRIPGYLITYGAADRYSARALATEEFVRDSLRPAA